MIRELWIDGRRVEQWDTSKQRVRRFDAIGRVTEARGLNNEEKHLQLGAGYQRVVEAVKR